MTLLHCALTWLTAVKAVVSVGRLRYAPAATVASSSKNHTVKRNCRLKLLVAVNEMLSDWTWNGIAAIFVLSLYGLIR